MPPAFKENVPPPGAAGAPDQWKTAEPKDDAIRGKWWEVFGDSRLNALEEKVLVSNQTLAQAEAQFRGARASVRGSRGDYFPTVTTSPSVTRANGTARGTAISSTATTYSLPVDLSWELDVFGRIRRNVEANVANAQASAADLEAVRLTLQSELADDYFQLRGVDAQKRILDVNVVGYGKALQLTVNRHDQGVVSGVDVAQAESLLFTTRAQSTDLSLARAQFEHAIAILVGEPPSVFSIEPDSAAYGPPPIPVAVPSELLERRPEIAASERRMAAANAQVGVATAAFFPRLLLAASGGYQASRLADWFSLPSRFWSIGPQLVATLFDGGRRRAATDQAIAFYDASVAVYRQNVLTAFGEVEDNLAALRILSDEAIQQADAVAASDRSVQLAQARYQGGITTYLEVVTAQTLAQTNQRVAVDLLTRRMTASVNLIKALGGGWNASELPSPDEVGERKEPAGRATAALTATPAATPTPAPK